MHDYITMLNPNLILNAKVIAQREIIQAKQSNIHAAAI